MTRDIEGNTVGVIDGGAAADLVAVCRSGKAQVAAAVLEGHVHVWETCAPGDNLAARLRCQDLAVRAIEVNETYVVALTEDSVLFAAYGEHDVQWTCVPLAGAVSASFDGELETIFYVATATGPRIIDAAMGITAAAVVPLHAVTSPWSNAETLADAQAMCRRPVDLQRVEIARSRHVPGPPARLVAGHHPLAAFATKDEVHICNSSTGGHAIVKEAAVAISVCSYVCVALPCNVLVYTGGGAPVRDILCISWPIDVLATSYGARVRSADGVDSLVFVEETEIYL